MVITIFRFNKSNESNPRILCGVPCKKQAIVGASRDNHVPGSGGSQIRQTASCRPVLARACEITFNQAGGKSDLALLSCRPVLVQA